MRISDWSSDVCCSDLVFEILAALLHGPPERRGDFAPVIAEEPERPFRGDGRIKLAPGPGGRLARITRHATSAESRVGKGCVSTFRSRWSPYRKHKQNDTNSMLQQHSSVTIIHL